MRPCTYIILISQIAELGRSPTAGRHKIWSFTPTHSPVLGKRTDPNSHHVLNGLTVDSLVLVQLEEEGKGEKQKGKNSRDGEESGKESSQLVCVVYYSTCCLSVCLPVHEDIDMI